MRIGPYVKDPKPHVKMASRMLVEDELEENAFMTDILHYVMKKGEI